MKLSKIILENKKVVVKEELNISNESIDKLTEAIATKLQDYLDIEDTTILNQAVAGAINELLEKNEL